MSDPTGETQPVPDPLEDEESSRSRSQVHWAGVLALALSFAYFLYWMAAPVRRSSPVLGTKISLRASYAVATEYEVTTTIMLDHRAPTPVLPMTAKHKSGLAVPDSWNERFVAIVWQDDRCREMLRSLGKDYLADLDDDGFLEILDGWGRPLIYVGPVSHTDAFTEDDFLPESSAPNFISAGPDGRFGDVRVIGDRYWQDNLSARQLD